MDKERTEYLTFRELLKQVLYKVFPFGRRTFDEWPISNKKRGSDYADKLGIALEEEGQNSKELFPPSI
jgi:hypothetical protein